jgi:hypothetical protein
MRSLTVMKCDLYVNASGCGNDHSYIFMTENIIFLWNYDLWENQELVVGYI